MITLGNILKIKMEKKVSMIKYLFRLSERNRSANSLVGLRQGPIYRGKNNPDFLNKVVIYKIKH